jgi:hypothetical protein
MHSLPSKLKKLAQKELLIAREQKERVIVI